MRAVLWGLCGVTAPRLWGDLNLASSYITHSACETAKKKAKGLSCVSGWSWDITHTHTEQELPAVTRTPCANTKAPIKNITGVLVAAFCDRC